KLHSNAASVGARGKDTVVRKAILALGIVVFLLIVDVARVSAACHCIGSHSSSGGVGDSSRSCPHAISVLESALYGAAADYCSSLGADSSCNEILSIGTCTVSSTQASVSGFITYSCLFCIEPPPHNP